MGYIRITTYKAAAYLMDALWKAGMLYELVEDGGDIVLFKTPGGELVSVHLIESDLPVYEIRQTLNYNAERGYYTLFMLWTRMMLPNHATEYRPEDWMEALFTLNGGNIYGYDVFEGEVFMFPVFFRGISGKRYIEHGTTIHAAGLRTHTVTTELPDFTGSWRVADMNGDPQHNYRTRMSPDERIELDDNYVLLGVTYDDDKETVKKAYRLLARRYHPDTNRSDEANDMMRRINDAYTQILKQLD
ncbi:MAG: J domain-containing protein [Aggregatilineales bacterium]